ncbi:Nuclear receptor subfamily 1 group I member 3 [Aix galericulata]|nr:Nuclear receptor subfamily 1 group I member 3 [Aix galericulata]
MSVSSPSDPESSPGTQWGPRVAEREDGEPEEEKVCAVCGDRATGYHFHVMTCEGCKGFFRRSINKGVHFTCPFARSCPVTKAKRRQCQACRLQKCLDVGMRKDMIMSEEALGRRRALRRQRRLAREQPGELTAEQRELIGILIAAHQRTFDSSFSQFVHYRVSREPGGRRWLNWGGARRGADPPRPLPQPAVRLYIPSPRSPSPSGPAVPSPQLECGAEDVLPDVFSMLPHFADLSTFMIQQVIKFAKEIPAFRSGEGARVGFWVCPPPPSTTTAASSGRRGLPIDDQISLLKGATLEICQIQFNTVFNAETNAWDVAQRDFIDQLQEKVALTLKSYIDHQHPMPEGRFLYAKLLLLLTELQTLKVENTRQILHIQDLSSMTPLLSEIIS